MRVLVYVALLGCLVAGWFWFTDRVRQRAVHRLPPSAGPAQLPAGADVVERATLAFGTERGPGTLRLTASQLVFTADSGRVTVLERYDILGVAATRELPDRSLAQPALAVSTASEVLYFVVASAGDWERRLTHD